MAVQAIGSSSGSGHVSTDTATASLLSQLARYQKQLSECVHCDSSKTAEGKAEIQALSTRISEIKERIDKVAAVKPSVRTDESATSTGISKSNIGIAPNSAIGGSIDVMV